MVGYKQKGASLFITLVILVVLTLLAVSSMRGVVLESKITNAFLIDSKLLNQAETTVASIENKINEYSVVLTECADKAVPDGHKVCINSKLLNKLVVDTDQMISHKGTHIEKLKSQWQIARVPTGQNPQLVDMLKGIGPSFFEITVKAELEDNPQERIYLRTVYLKSFSG